jgi:uncharacterized protein (TIGR00159 family)
MQLVMRFWEWLTGGNAWLQMLRLGDLTAVLLIFYALLTIKADQRTLSLLRGVLTLVALNWLTQYLGLQLLQFVIDRFLLLALIATAVILQTELRRLLERLGQWHRLRGQVPRTREVSNHMTVAIAEAVKDLSQKKVGALILLETGEPIEERHFNSPGIRLDARLSKELLQSLFQSKTPLHDGAVVIRGDTIVSASVVFPLSKRPAPSGLGTRHRAAMGIAEIVDDCICIVVSEETGSIAIAEGDTLNRPVTNQELREFLEERFAVNRPTTLVHRRVPHLGQILSQLLRNFGRKSPKK